MYLKLTKEDILTAHTPFQLDIKKKYLLDLLFYTPNLSNQERGKINDLLLLIQNRKEFLQEEYSA